jgi:class 3 adenylate cyclase/DNA-binding response OmpR family regulator
LANETILVVDDSHENRLFLERYVLGPAGYQVLTAASGAEGLNRIMEAQPDLLLLDLQMPGMNGVEVINALHARGIQIPVILMTYHGSEEIAIQVFRLGVRDYIVMPFTPDELLASVEGALTESRLRSERDALTRRLVLANQRLERRLRELNALAGIGRSVTALMETEELLSRIIEGAVYLVRADKGRIILHHLSDGQLYVRAIKEEHKPRATLSSEPTSDPLVCAVIQSQQSALVTREQEGFPLEPGIGAALCVPLLKGEAAIGAIEVTVKQHGRRFTTNDRSVLGAVADYAAVSLENTRLFNELEAAKEREKQEIRRIFQTYVAPSVVEKVISDPTSLQLGGGRQQVTTLYADIRGFTSFAETVAPEELIGVLNSYFALMARTVLENEGTLDKFLGDAVMAFFNAPTPQPDHPLRAARTALAIQKAVKAHRHVASTGGPLAVGVGFASGEAVVGHVGTMDRMDYTIIGDSVNLARRLQEEAEPGQILLDSLTYKMIEDHVIVEELGERELKGKSRPQQIFELKGMKE